jgi:hypothetical protein
VTSDALDQTERGRILQIVRGELSFPRVGRVVTVWPHTGDESVPSNHEVDVAIPPGEPVQEPRRVPIMQPTGGAAYLPREGDLVLVGYLQGQGERPVVLGAVYGDADQDRAPTAGEGDVRLRRDNTTVEITSTDAGDDIVRVTRQPEDADTPDMGLELNLSTGEFQIGDGSGYGITSDGSGNFQWFLESLDYVTDGSTLSW